jgi:hypothetical protein
MGWHADFGGENLLSSTMINLLIGSQNPDTDSIGKTQETFHPSTSFFFAPTYRIEASNSVILVGDPT